MSIDVQSPDTERIYKIEEFIQVIQKWVYTYVHIFMYVHTYVQVILYIHTIKMSGLQSLGCVYLSYFDIRNYTLPPSAHISVGNYVCYEYTLYTQRERVYIMYILYVCTCIMNTGDTYVYMYPVYTYTPRMQHIRIILRTICTHSHYDISTVCTNVHTP